MWDARSHVTRRHVPVRQSEHLKGSRWPIILLAHYTWLILSSDWRSQATPGTQPSNAPITRKLSFLIKPCSVILSLTLYLFVTRKVDLLWISSSRPTKNSTLLPPALSLLHVGLTTDIQLGLKLVTLHLGPLTKYGKYPRTSQASAKSNTTKVVLCNMTFLSYRVLYTLKPGTCDV